MIASNFRILPSAAAAALLFATAASSAQPTVQLYGIVDAGVTRVSGLTGGTVTQVASGIMEGSRWGLRGNEDLGGGYRAIFTLENRFEVDTGSLSSRPISGSQLPDRLSSAAALGLPGALNGAVQTLNSQIANESLGVNVGSSGNRLFDRQAFLGLVTPVGAFIAGRQYTPVFEIVANFDSMKTQSALAAGQLVTFPSGAIDIRLSNTLQYRIQQGGVTANLMYGMGEADTATNSGVNRFYGFMAMYKGDGFSVGAGYNTRNNDVGQKSLTNTAVGGSLDVGPGTLGVLYVTNKDRNPSVNAIRTSAALGPFANTVANAYATALQQDGQLFHVGYQVTFGANTVTFSVNSFNDGTAANADSRSFGVAHTYALSKRTDLNFVLARVNNNANSQVALGGNGYLGGFTRAAGVDSTSISFGVRHRF
jgi:predicted porin